VWVGPYLQSDIASVANQLKRQTQPTMREWATQSTDPEPTLMDDTIMFSREWGGYEGPYRIWISADPFSKTVAAWRDEHIAYWMVNGNSTIEQQAEWARRKPQLLHLKTIPPPTAQADQWAGPRLSMYRLSPMEHQTAYPFGIAATVVGYDLSASAVQRGSTVRVRLYWQGQRALNTNLSVFVHLWPQDEIQIYAQADGSPRRARPTSTWDDPDEVIVGDWFALAVPQALPAETYRVAIGVYDSATGQRLATADGKGYIVLTTIKVLDAPAS